MLVSSHDDATFNLYRLNKDLAQTMDGVSTVNCLIKVQEFKEAGPIYEIDVLSLNC